MTKTPCFVENSSSSLHCRTENVVIEVHAKVHFVCESNQEIPHIERMQLKFASIIECRTVLA
jgi:hypothetical protein